jgi:tetratricopeptide (TPR) repeat protein
MQTGDAGRARQRLERVVVAAPGLGAAYRLLADVHRVSGDAAQAERLVARAARLDAYTAPHDPVIEQLARESRNSVFLLKQIGAADARRDAAWREWLARRATEVDPANPDVIYEMGALLQQAGRSREAVPFFTRHLDMVSDKQQTLVQIGKCYSDLGDLDRAEDSLRRALAIADDAVGWYNLGYVMEQRGQAAMAEAYYEKALASDPSLASAHNNLATLLARRGQVNDALAHLQTVVRLQPSNRDGYTNLGAVLLQQGKAAAAEVYLRMALELDPSHADAHANMGAALAHRGRYADALRHLDEALRLDPNHQGAKANREVVAKSLR